MQAALVSRVSLRLSHMYIHMAISRIGWYAIWLISLLSYAGAHRVSPLGVSPFAWMQSPADPEAKPIFPNLGLKSGAWKFEKKSFHAILVRM